MINPRMNVYYDHRNEENRVRALQEMLRTVARLSGDMTLSTAVDGNFDNGTENALRAFQRKYGLTENGEADLATWEKLREIYTLYLLENSPPDPIMPFYSGKMRVLPGEKSHLVMILQIMLAALRVLYDGYGELPISGVYDGATGEAIRQFQKANLLSATGEVDLMTWNRLAAEYNYVAKDRK